MGATHALLAVMTWLQAAPAPLDLGGSEATKAPAFRNALDLRDALCPLLLRTKNGRGPATQVSAYLPPLKARGKPTVAVWRDEGESVHVALESPVFSSAELLLAFDDAPNTSPERRLVRSVVLLFRAPTAAESPALSEPAQSPRAAAKSQLVCRTARLFGARGQQVEGVHISPDLAEPPNELDTRP